MKRIAMGRVNIARAHTWFRRGSRLPDVGPLDPSIHSQGNTWDFMKALVDLTLPSTSVKIPDTFFLDEERLIKVRSDMLDLINLEICMHMFRSLEATNRIQEARFIPRDDTPVASFVSSPCYRPASPADDSMFSSPTLPLEHHFMPKDKLDTAQERNFSRASYDQNVEDEIIASVSPSPQSSPSTSASTPATYPPTPFYLSLPTADTESQARSSLKAILASDNTCEKWTSLSSSLALQILRSANTSLTHLPQFESHLAFQLSNPRSRSYQEAENRVLSRLFPILQRLVEKYKLLTSMQIFEAAIAPKGAPGSLGARGAEGRDETAQIATIIAHVGILHWRVWAPLAYLVDPDAEADKSKHRVSSPP